MGILLDPTALMTVRVARWLDRVPAGAPIFMPAALDDLVGAPTWPDLGLFCGQGLWAHSRVLQCRARLLDPRPFSESGTFARTCEPERSTAFGAAWLDRTEGGPVGDPEIWPYPDRLIAPQMWAGMASGLWAAMRRPPLLDALAGAGLLIVTSSGSSQAWREVLTRHEYSLEAPLLEALSRRVRYLARAVPPPAAEQIIDVLAADSPWFSACAETTAAVIEVFDAGPAVQGGPWR